ncbi:UNVERIFIED_CONTAM: hypothetical protein GTU68_053720 [Idotea baltica]|nr:hypothetical protein [Idotea baltica]
MIQLIILKQNETLESQEKLIVVLSISTQAILSIAARFNMGCQEALERTIGYFKSLGVDYVFDVNFARSLSIIEAQREFVQKFKSREEGNVHFPLLASACPGWVCYAEKTHGSYILPHISRTRSPQQVMGSLLKDYWSAKHSIPPNKIYHASLMPCFDKKLEASREEFNVEEFDTREVDCVITSVEVEQLLEKEEVDLGGVERAGLDPELSLSPDLRTHEGSGSGGFAHHVFTYAAKHLFGVEGHEMTWKSLRNNDMQELTLEVSGEAVLRFAIANGFRNIQNLVQKVKRGKSPYHYVEVMACPSGCLNGGAQIRASSGQSSKELIAFLEGLYKGLPTAPPEEEGRVVELYSEWLGGQDSEKVRDKLHTTYKAIEKSNNPLGIKW